MLYRRFHRPSKRQVFAGMMICSLVSLLLPGDIFGPLRGLTQSVTTLQWGVREPTRLMGEQIRTAVSGAVSAMEHAELERSRMLLKNEVVALHSTISQLESSIAELAGLRQQGVPSDISMIPARVVGQGAAPGRDSLTLNKGHSSGISGGDWVVSRMAEEDPSTPPVPESLDLLPRECLIGRVETVNSSNVQVVLLSDPVAVRALRVQILAGDGQCHEFILSGAGGGKMHLRDVPLDLVERNYIQVGDLVTSSPHESGLPMALVIGRITELERNRDEPLHFNAVVQPRWDTRALGRVYVVGMAPSNHS